MKFFNHMMFLVIMFFSINQGRSQGSVKKKDIKGNWTTIELEIGPIDFDTMASVGFDWFANTVNDILLQKDTLLFFTSGITNIVYQNDISSYFSLELKSFGEAILNYHIGDREPPPVYSVHNYRWKIQKDRGKKYLLIKHSPLAGFKMRQEFRFEILSVNNKYIPESERFFRESFYKELLLRNVTE